MNVTTDLPPWSFAAAQYIAQKRLGRFGNRFRSRKLRSLHKDQPYFKNSESIIGYMGDVGASIYLSADPIDMLCTMIDLTDGLAHRDQFDVWFNGYHIDAKIEDYAERHHQVLSGSLGPREPYGNRLINADQWEENHGFTDIYLFGCFDPQMGEGRLIHQIDRIRWVGYATAQEVEAAPSGGFIPGGPRLPMRAKIIPHGQLHALDQLFTLPMGPRARAMPKHRPEHEQDVLKRIKMLQDGLRGIAVSRPI